MEGLPFKQVTDSSQSDIRLGWGNFGTASSGVVGYTSYQYQNGQLSPNVTIRLEDPSNDALVAGTGTASSLATPSTSLSYSGTQANLYQVLLHEIGHALGLSDNADPNSVMYYQATGSANSTLDSTDIAGMQALYGATPSVSFGVSAQSAAAANSVLLQLSQATAAFHSELSAASSTFVPPASLVSPPPLLAASH